MDNRVDKWENTWWYVFYGNVSVQEQGRAEQSSGIQTHKQKLTDLLGRG